MSRLDLFEKMLSDIQRSAEEEKEKMDALKASGKEKSATYKLHLGNHLMYKEMLAMFQSYGLTGNVKKR